MLGAQFSSQISFLLLCICSTVNTNFTYFKWGKISHCLNSHHVSVLKVSIVLQQVPHHLDVSLLSCRDQCRPAVLYTDTTCYFENSHSLNPVDRASVRAINGTLEDGQKKKRKPHLPAGRTRCSWERGVASRDKGVTERECETRKGLRNGKLPLSSLTLSAPCVIIGYITWDVNKWCESNACVRRSRRLHACVSVCWDLKTQGVG